MVRAGPIGERSAVVVDEPLQSCLSRQSTLTGERHQLIAQHPISFFFESPRHAEPAISLSGTHESSTASDGFSALHDVLAEGADDVHQLLMLSCRHLVLVKGLREVANNNFEVGVSDPEPGVHRLRRTADHFAWTSGNIAHQVLVLLFETVERVRAHTDKELANFWMR